MKVLIVHQHFKEPHTGGAIRSYLIARALVENGITVSVITVHEKAVYLNKIIDGIDVHFLPIAYDNSFGFSARILSFLRFTWKTIGMVRQFRNFDLMYVISVPLTTGLTGLWGKWRYRIPYYFEVGDLWPDAPIHLGFIKNRFFIWCLYQLENLIYRHSKIVVALSPMIKEAIKKKWKRTATIVIPNMADTDFYRHEPKQLELVKKFNVSNKFVVSYTGAIGYANGLDFLLDCARNCLQENIPVQFLICGEGAGYNHLVKRAGLEKIINVEFLSFRNREGIKELLNVSDAIFVCYRPEPILETGSPNKFSDGLAAGKMIILNFEGWIKEEIIKAGCGIFMKTPESFASQIRPYLDDARKLEACQKASRGLAENNFSREMLSSQLVKIIKEEKRQ